MASRNVLQRDAFHLVHIHKDVPVKRHWKKCLRQTEVFSLKISSFDYLSKFKLHLPVPSRPQQWKTNTTPQICASRHSSDIRFYCLIRNQKFKIKYKVIKRQLPHLCIQFNVKCCSLVGDRKPSRVTVHHLVDGVPTDSEVSM